MFEIKDPYAPSEISGKIAIQGRTNYQETITFELRTPGQTTPVKTYQVLTTQDGSYSLDNVSPGTYDLTAKSSNTLRAKQGNISVVDGQTTSNINFNLLGGDCDNNNVINAFDKSILNKAFGSTEGSPKWDPRADLDANKVINAFDKSILNSNFGKAGAN